jgi:hypothetical protein
MDRFAGRALLTTGGAERGGQKGDAVQIAIEPRPLSAPALRRSLGCAFQVPEGAVRDRLQGPQRLRFVFTLADGRKRVRALVTRETPPPAA